VRTIGQFIEAFDAILQCEGVGTFVLACQSYGGMAQAYPPHKPKSIERLTLSSTGPADYGKAWLPASYAMIALARLLPEQTVKGFLTGRLLKIITLSADKREEWLEAIQTVIRDDLSRADVISHFAVAADLVAKGIVTPAAYHDWKGRAFVLSAENDPTQGTKDIPRYEKLLGHAVHLIKLGDMGHTAVLFNPGKYVALFEQALAA